VVRDRARGRTERNAAGADGVRIGGTQILSITDHGLKPTTEYVYEVAALDAGKNESVPSAPLRVTTTREYWINFQYGTEESLAGYQIDAGSAYDFRKGYGWDRKLNSRTRTSPADPRLNTFVFSSTSATWRYDIPNDDYLVSLASGDASYGQGPRRVVAVDGISTGANEFAAARGIPITVNDGDITIEIGSGSGSAALNYVIIKTGSGSGQLLRRGPAPRAGGILTV